MTVQLPGGWSPELDLEGFSWSPDDGYLAVWEPTGRVRCLETATWREVLSIPGAPVGSVTWPSSEAMWVVRGDGALGARVIAHAVPDGGVLGVAKLPSGGATHHAVTVGMDGTVLVAPRQWNLGSRTGGRLRLAYVLRGECPEVKATVDPAAHDVLGTLPWRRQCMAALSPDGQRVAVVYGGALTVPVDDPVTRVAGDLVLVHWGKGASVRAAPGGRMPVSGVRWAGPSTVVVQGTVVNPREDITATGEVLVLDAALGTVRFDTHRDLEGRGMEPDDGGDGGVGGTATVDLHPDRQRLLVTGRATDPRGTAEAPRWLPALRTVDIAEGTASPLRRLRGKTPPGGCGVWLDDTEAMAVLTCRTVKNARVDHWPSLDEVTPGEGLALVLHGVRPTRVQLMRSPTGRWLTAHWRSSPSAHTSFTRVAVFPTEAVAGLPRR